MARSRRPRHRICRRLGTPICGLPKCPAQKRPYPPGQHGPKSGRRRESEYGVQLKEKQKLRAIYGVLETQFRHYFAAASRAKGRTGEELMKLVERRLDNLVYRLGLAHNRLQARQLVRHGHVHLDGRRTTIPSLLVAPGQRISIPGWQSLTPVQQALEERRVRPAYLEFEAATGTGTLVREPARDEIPEPVNEGLIVEFYSR